MQEIDYEALPGVPFQGQMLAGALAGMAEHLVTHPLDTIKTNMQQLNRPQINAFTTAAQMVKTAGVASLFGGIWPVMMSSGAAHAFYFGAYEQAKAALVPIDPTEGNYMALLVSGIAASASHDAVATPFDVVKQRMQLGQTFPAIFNTYRKEGFHHLYRSYFTTIIHTAPFHMIQITGYETLSRLLNPEKKYRLDVHCFAGGIAGGIASVITHPLDVAKTALQTGAGGEQLKGLKSAISYIYNKAGPLGFLRGIGARTIQNVMATSISWAAYESFKIFMTRKQFN